MTRPLRLLMVESETEEARDKRRRSVGKSSGETYGATLEQMEPGCEVVLVSPAEGAAVMSADEIATFDAVFISGAPLHVYADSPAVRRQIAFMRAVFASGTPSFGSCAGLQVAVAAAGGTVRKMSRQREAGLGRRITATDEGRGHKLLAGRPPAWDAFTVHGDEVESLPDGAVLLATNSAARVQAVEIRHGGGVFWGVQYHPELSPGEIGAALRRDRDTLIANGLARTDDEVEQQARLLDQLHDEPDRTDLHWQLGIDGQVADERLRRTELGNFIDHLVRPTRAAREAERREREAA